MSAYTNPPVGHGVLGQLPFRVLELLGQGGMGRVYRAVDTAGRTVALKVLIRPQNERGVQRLLREGTLTASLQHPNLVRLLDVGRVGEHPFLSYELIEGAKTLDEVHDGLSLTKRLRILCGVAAGVAHAHEHGVVHRDLKPGNVLVDAELRPRVMDFGLSTTGDVERLTLSGAMLGTPLLMSPEQAQGRRDLHGPPTDVWALGVMLYQALTDALPFEGPDMPTLFVAITSGNLVPPRRRRPRVSRALEEVCLRALNQDPSQRYADARAFLLALDAALPKPGVVVAQEPRRARPHALVGGVLLVAALAAGAVLALTSGETPTAPVAAGEDEAADPLVEIERLLGLKDNTAVLRLAEEALRVAPSDPRLWTAKGEAHLGLDSAEEGSACLRKALDLEPSARRHVGLAACLLQVGRAEDALPELDAAIELDPSYAQAWAIRSLVHYEGKRHSAALDDANRAVAADPNSAEAWNHKGLAHSGLGENRQATRALRTSLELEDNPTIRSNLAVMLANDGRLSEGIELLEEAVRRDPGNPKFHKALGFTHYLARRYADALPCFDMALELNPDSIETRCNRAHTYARLGRIEEAISDFEHAVEHAPASDPNREFAIKALAELRER